MDGVVLLTSVARQVHEGGNMRRSARLRALYTDRRRHNVLFDNLHHRDTAPASRQELQGGLALLTAAEWCCRLGGVGGAQLPAACPANRALRAPNRRAQLAPPSCPHMQVL